MTSDLEVFATCWAVKCKGIPRGTVPVSADLCVCVYLHVYMIFCLSLIRCVCVFVCIWKSLCAFFSVCVERERKGGTVCVCVCMKECVCVCVCVCMCVCV